MDATKQSSLSSFKSKKLLRSPAPSDRKVSDPNPDPLSVKTPGKPVDPPRRLRNRGVALSIADIRKAALKLRERGSDPAPSTDPVSRPDEEEVAKPKKSAASEIKLPENLDCSIRLLQLKGSATTFTNISSQIETLTERRFTYSHLAQLKFLMPEAIVLEKYLQHDERTSCMKPDLRITLDAEAIKSKGKSNSHSGNLKLRKVFRSRLVDFFKSHPEGDEVPEEVLLEPFSRPKENISANSAQPSGTASMGERQGVAFSGLPVRASILPPSFKRSFSQRVSDHQVEKLKQEFIISAHPSVNSEDKFAGSSSGKEISEVARGSASETCFSYEASMDCKTLNTFPETPVKCVNPVEDEDECSNGVASVLKTPVGMASTPAKLMSATPTLKPTKRCYMSPEKSLCTTPNKLVRRPPPNRPLKFETPVKKNLKIDDNEFCRRGNSSTRDDIFGILPQSVIQSIQEKERLASLEQDPAISQAIRRRKMIACLPKLFDKVYFYFQSIRRSVITKEELMQILISQLDVVDKREVEEQLRLLQELAPEWIYEKSAMSGDLLLCVNKISSAEAMRTRLSEAI
ncbi:hypothetical protein C2S53_006625 [Perilla frutescens var. hirtella]|uniref:CDT1 Geminin-binding domain-containing protein n=1 Tax=Perilla frutescens var. hirtella TaxID=608512 RepID=A0AAD4P7I0_PERFH|nr:hypothetical protein C2S53_006625 [Perilla frutescens var. hirtella]